MEKKYQVICRNDRQGLVRWLTRHGQGLLALVELIASTELALEELIDVSGRATIEAVLELSALQIAGQPHRGRRDGEIIWHGRQTAWGSHPRCAARHMKRVLMPMKSSRAITTKPNFSYSTTFLSTSVSK